LSYWPITSNLCLFMYRMLAAKLAVLEKIQFFRSRPFVLVRRIISALAFGTGQIQ